jgi:hypothetical protein
MKLIATENIPNRREIKKRFDNRLRGVAPMFEPITELLSEEAERIIHETWRTPEVQMTIKSHWASERHYCRNCGTQKIYPSHHFCPHCGIKIIWND